jgi:hypothetical protein
MMRGPHGCLDGGPHEPAGWPYSGRAALVEIPSGSALWQSMIKSPRRNENCLSNVSKGGGYEYGK